MLYSLNLTFSQRIPANPANSDGQHFPSFFQNSSPGTCAKEASATEEQRHGCDTD